MSKLEKVEENDLEEAARRIATRYSHITGDTYYANDAWFFKKGARWQKEQIQHNVEIAKQFIEDCTRACSNELISIEDIHGTTVISYHEWLTPEQALRAVEITTKGK